MLRGNKLCFIFLFQSKSLQAYNSFSSFLFLLLSKITPEVPSAHKFLQGTFVISEISHEMPSVPQKLTTSFFCHDYMWKLWPLATWYSTTKAKSLKPLCKKIQIPKRTQKLSLDLNLQNLLLFFFNFCLYIIKLSRWISWCKMCGEGCEMCWHWRIFTGRFNIFWCQWTSECM